MKCVICGEEFSPRVCKIHEETCKTNGLDELKFSYPETDLEEASYKDLYAEAKEKGLNFEKKPNKADLIEALRGVV